MNHLATVGDIGATDEGPDSMEVFRLLNEMNEVKALISMHEKAIAEHDSPSVRAGKRSLEKRLRVLKARYAKELPQDCGPLADDAGYST